MARIGRACPPHARNPPSAPPYGTNAAPGERHAPGSESATRAAPARRTTRIRAGGSGGVGSGTPAGVRGPAPHHRMVDHRMQTLSAARPPPLAHCWPTERCAGEPIAAVQGPKPRPSGNAGGSGSAPRRAASGGTESAPGGCSAPGGLLTARSRAELRRCSHPQPRLATMPPA